MLARSLEQFGSLGEVAAELGRQRKLSIFARHADTHAKAKVLSRFAGLRVLASLYNLLQLFHRVEAEGLAAVLVIRLSDCTPTLDRVHKAQVSLGQRLAHQTYFSNGGDIVMRHARFPQDLNQIRRRVRFDSVKHLAGKLLDKEPCSAPGCVWAI